VTTALTDAFTASLHRDLLAEYDPDRYVHDPTAWVRETLTEEVWSKEDQVLTSLVEHRRTAVQSCHGVGKSHTASRAAAWWLSAHPAGEAFVVSTAPTFPQVRAILWRYIRQAHRKGNLPGRVNQTEWLLGDELVGYGRKPADHDAQAFQGIHARYVLVIIDEACGVPETLWVSADSLTTNPDCRILAIGNPDNPSSHFREVCQSPLWNQIQISAFDSPNLTDEQVSPDLAALLISRSWVEEKAQEWGVDNPIYQSKVLGQFPSDDPNAVIRWTDLVLCRKERVVPYLPDELLPVELGVDVGGGGDQTVIRERLGMKAGREWTSKSDRPEDLAPLIVRAITETGATRVKVDAIGIGWGVIGELRNLADQGVHRAEIVEVKVSEAASRPDKFANLRAELWWEVGRVASEQRAWDLSGLTTTDGDRLCAQLVEPHWDIDPKGRIRVEPKKDIIKRLGRSPDNADAALLAFYGGQNTAGFFEQLLAQQQADGQPPPMVQAIQTEQARGNT
jgi:hypothetical protein